MPEKPLDCLMIGGRVGRLDGRNRPCPVSPQLCRVVDAGEKSGAPHSEIAQSRRLS